LGHFSSRNTRQSISLRVMAKAAKRTVLVPDYNECTTGIAYSKVARLTWNYDEIFYKTLLGAKLGKKDSESAFFDEHLCARRLVRLPCENDSVALELTDFGLLLVIGARPCRSLLLALVWRSCRFLLHYQLEELRGSENAIGGFPLLTSLHNRFKNSDMNNLEHIPSLFHNK
jgi:hypothetical protein